ncbi:MAG: hypothetical protein IJ279_03230 [Clostridia bacterium]|nr:hypothetical protein [Clostridia bacterium]
MKTSPYSPDKFMAELYEKNYKDPYEFAETKEDVLKINSEIRASAKEIFCLDKIEVNSDFRLEKAGDSVDFGTYTLEKCSVQINSALKMLVYISKPKKITSPAGGVVALCGHGYGVRQILSINKKGKKKRIRYFDNYQKSFAHELAKRGLVVISPELFGFGEARLGKDLIKPFYISSCDELSHHLLPYGITTASMRILQAIICGEILLKCENVDKDKLSCMGISGGGLTALYASVLDERFKKTVVSGYVNTFRDSILSLWHCPDNYIPNILSVGEIYDFASSLSPRKLLIESGRKDKLFPFEASRKAHEKIKKIYALAGAEENLIIDVFDGKHSVSGKLAFDFLSE